MGKWKYNPPAFLMSALNGGGWSASCSGCFTARERIFGAHQQEAGWALEPVWM
jgi:hypothetical protein